MMNYPVAGLIILATIAVVILMIMRDRKDQRAFERDILGKPDPKAKESNISGTQV